MQPVGIKGQKSRVFCLRALLRFTGSEFSAAEQDRFVVDISFVNGILLGIRKQSILGAALSVKLLAATKVPKFV